MTIYLTGGCSEANVEAFRAAGVGLMLTPHQHRKNLHGLRWAADTGCFRHPDRFDLAAYLERLRAWRPTGSRMLFATAPDVLGDPEETWERSRPVLHVLRRHGYQAALVAQDGIDRQRIDWDAFDVLFIGGSTPWKLAESTWQLAREAQARGKWTHLGRVNSGRRFAAAAAAGYDSADGNFVAFGPDVRLPDVERWLLRAEAQPSLWSSDAHHKTATLTEATVRAALP